MSAVSQALVQRRVFLNVPYDGAYEQNFLALLSALISIGRIPRCAAEERVLGGRRLDQIFKLLRGCKVSIHDLCRVTRPPRFAYNSAVAGRGIRGKPAIMETECRQNCASAAPRPMRRHSV